MAQSKSFYDDIKKEIECPVCQEQFSDVKEPKVLRCQHTFCKSCLDGWFRQQGGRALSCPTCREITKCPNNDINSLPSNLAYKKLRDILKAHSENASHDFVSEREDVCKRHKEKVKFYCEQCEICICSECVIFEHRDNNSHKILSLEEGARKQKAIIERKMRQVAVNSSRLRGYTSSLEKRRAKANKSIEQATKELNRVAELSINSILQHQASVTELLTREKSSCDDAFSKQLSKLAEKIQEMDNLSALSSDVLQRNDLKEMLNMSELLDERIAMDKTPLLNCPEFKYTPNDALSAPGKLFISNTEPSLSTASGEGLGKGTIGEESSFAVFTKNSRGQTIYSEIDNVNIEIKSKQKGMAGIRPVVRDLKDGRYSISYRPSVAGEFSVSIKVREEPIKESPFKLMVSKKTAINDCWPPFTLSKQQVIENEAIQLLSQGHLRRIHTLEQRYDVSISVEKAVGRIVVRGQSGDFLGVVGEIHKILHQLREEEHERKRAEALSKDIQWMYDDGTYFVHYESHVNAMIEIAYHEKKPTVTITSDDGQDYEIDFKKMTEEDEYGNVIQVRRNDLRKGAQLPNHWTPQPNDPQGIEKIVHLFQLDPSKNVQEYQNVQSRFQRTCGNHIVKIERVQNPALYGTYAIRKQKMDEAKGSNEQLLFHGNSGNNCQLINHTGFNRSFHGKNATMYGNGVYFALDASYSARSTHSPADLLGFRYMYLTRVLVGEYTVGRQGLLSPPAKNPNDPTDTYDSVVDQMPNPAIFVVFYDWQCYPEYLITFQ